VLTDLSSGRQADETGTEDTAPPAVHRIRRLGDIVEITFDGHAVAVRLSKGVTDIVTLIEASGRDVHCVELADVSVEQASTGEIIDAAARRQYEDRIRELQADLDEAEANSDYGRAYRYQTELDALIDHLAAALGRGHRNRRAADSAERARSAVTHRIRSAIRQITSVNPGLGAHLSHAISTGTYCSYRPANPTTWVTD
jgi:hypothetical protein